MKYIGNQTLHQFIESREGEKKITRILNAANQLMLLWVYVSKEIEVTKDHPRYKYIMEEVFHDGQLNLSIVLGWSNNTDKNIIREANYEDNLTIALRKLWDSILAAEYIHQMENKI